MNREASASPRPFVSAMVVACANPTLVATFWHRLLGGEIVVWEQFGVVALRAPGITFDFTASTDEKTTNNRWHLDIASNDPTSTIAAALELGATIAADFASGDGHIVLRDPEGNEFCVLHHGASFPWEPPAS
jgi:predicted enzyme related to lactoylglutathione lyase